MFVKVSTELNIAQDILSSVKIHGPRAAEAFDAKLESYLGEGRTITGTADVQEALTNWITIEIDKVEEAERVHLDEIDNLAEVVQRRLDEKSVLYAKVMDVRKTFEGVIGEGESSKQVGLDAGLSKVASPVLRRHARRALRKLEAPDFQPSPKVPGARLAPQETAEDLRPVLVRFEATLKQLAEQRRITQEAQRLRQEALDGLHLVTFNGSQIIQSSYTLAGERFHAERIRQKLGRPAARKKSPAEDTADGAAAGGVTAADDVTADGVVTEAETPVDTPPDSAGEPVSG